jgi:hypothetical protein
MSRAHQRSAENRLSGGVRQLSRVCRMAARESTQPCVDQRARRLNLEIFLFYDLSKFRNIILKSY